jgi:hypothetical protein
MSDEMSPRVPLDEHPELRAAIDAALDAEGLTYNERKRLERWRRVGLPGAITPFVRDPRMARALLAVAERPQAA